MEIGYKFDFKNLRPIRFTFFVKPSATNPTSTLPRFSYKVFSALTALNFFPLLSQSPIEVAPTDVAVAEVDNDFKREAEDDESIFYMFFMKRT